MLATAKNYAYADHVEKLINEDLGRAPRFDHPCRDDYHDSRGQNDNHGQDDSRDRWNDNRDRRDNRDFYRNNLNSYKGKRVRDDNEVNTVK